MGVAWSYWKKKLGFKEAMAMIIVFVFDLIHQLNEVCLKVFEIEKVIIVVQRVIANSVLPNNIMITDQLLLKAFSQIPDQQAQSQSSFVYQPQAYFWPLQSVEPVLLSLFFLYSFYINLYFILQTEYFSCYLLRYASI